MAAGMRRSILFATGLSALVSTIVLVCLAMVVAVHVAHGPLPRTTALISGSLEATVCIMLACFTSTTVLTSLSWLVRRSSAASLAVLFGCAALACVVAMVASVVAVAFLGAEGGSGSGGSATSLLVASCFFLVAAVLSQAAFLSAHYLSCRQAARDGTDSLFTDDSSRLSPKLRVKAIPYSRTRPSLNENRGAGSLDSIDMPPLDGRRWPAAPMSTSPRSSFSHTVRPVTSQTRLIPPRGRQGRLHALDSTTSVSTLGDPRDNWDAVSAISRSTAPEPASAPPTRTDFPHLLETIPASPSSKVPGVLDPPAPARRRGRSFSPTPPASRRRGRSAAISPMPSSEQLDIHPLFRTDSPTPPPVATPGTVVRASPDAGKVIHNHPSCQSLRRLASGSAVSLVSSPLSRKSSLETVGRSIREADEARPRPHAEPVPPIPDFVLGAGSRLSLTRYNSKKNEGDEDEDEEDGGGGGVGLGVDKSDGEGDAVRPSPEESR